MSGKHLVYRALMPTHYLPRVVGGSQATDVDGSRKWEATRLPNLRVFGDLWSFGFTVAELTSVQMAPGGGPGRVFGLRVLADDGLPEKTSPLAQMHHPRLLQAEVIGFLQVTGTGSASSRISILALDTITDTMVNEKGEFISVNGADLLNAFPVRADSKPSGNATVILAPYGDPFERPDEQPQDGKPPPKPIPMTDPLLPAMRLAYGRVRVKTTLGYLGRARKQLGLGTPEGGGRKEIVLLPDGFALHGGVRLPWQNTQEAPVDGWFKVSLKAVDGQQARPVMAPWFDPDGDATATAAQRHTWDAMLARLRSVVASAQAAGGPAWLDLRLSDRLRPEDLELPLAFKKVAAKDEIGAPVLVHRPGNSFELAGQALTLRLADRRQAERPVASLTIAPERFALERDGDVLRLTTNLTGSEGEAKGAPTATYLFGDGPEKIALTTGTRQEVDLAIPLVETAEMLRQAAGLAAPTLTQGDNPEFPEAQRLLWTFTPVDVGWLHWPMPNLTATTLDWLRQGAKVSETKAMANDPADGISGAVIFSNHAGSAGASEQERRWSLSLSEPRRVAVRIDFALSAPGQPPKSVQIDLHDPAIILDGGLPVVPFRQTETRLLPDHAERALTARSLSAISPRRLGALEAHFWGSEDGPRMMLRVDKLTVQRDGTRGVMSAADLVLQTRLPVRKAPSAWLWARHPTLPTVQAMPLAVAGIARSVPGEARTFAPLVDESGDRPYHFDLALDRTVLPLRRDKGSFGAGQLRRPTIGANWQPEVGMVVTTLPSASLFPGVPGGPGLPLASKGWGSFDLTGGTRLVLRHDLALRDEANAMAVPPPPGDSADNQPLASVFRPGLHNGPGVPGKETGVLADVWAQMNRKAALAATDRRILVEGTGQDDAVLSGLWADVTLKGKVAFSAEVTREDDQIKEIGSWSFADDEVTVGGAGLPAGGDHAGLSLMLPVGDGNKAAIVIGSAEVLESGAGFADPLGVAHSGTVLTAHGVIRELGRNPKDLRLFTLTNPLAVANNPGLRFWCADVPALAETAQDPSPLQALAEADTDGQTLRLNGAGLDGNLGAGFRWWFGHAGRQDRVVQVDGMSFEPLALTDLRLNADGLLAKAVLTGRLHLPGQDNPAGGGPMPGGVATLLLTRQDHDLVPSLDARNLVWPLAVAGGASVTAPVLRIPVLPALGKTAGATLDIRMDGKAWTVGIDLKRQAKGAVLSGTTTGKGGIGDAQDGAALTLEIMDDVAKTSATLDLPVEMADGLLGLSGKLRFDLVRGGQPQPQGKWSLRIGTRALTQMEAIVASLKVEYADGVLGAVWTGLDGSASGSPLLPFALRGGQAWMIATVEADAKSGGLPSFPKVRARLGARLPLALGEDTPLVLGCEPAPGDGASVLRLRGQLTVKNVFSWPFLATEPRDGFVWATVPVDETGRFTHRADVIFDGGALIAEGETGLACPAAVRHTIVLSKADRPETSLVWQSHQHLRLMSREGFRSLLAAHSPPKNVSKLNDLPTGFSPVGPKGPRDWNKATAIPHHLHLSAANAGWFAGPLAAALNEALAEGPDFLVLDLSAHHALFDTATGAAAGHLVSLPAVALVTTHDNADLLTSDEIRKRLSTKPNEELQLALHLQDGPAGRVLPSLDDATRDGLAFAVGAALQRLPSVGRSLAEAILGSSSNPPRAVFQPVALALTSNGWRTAADWPGAGPAINLSASFAGLGAGTKRMAGLTLWPAPRVNSADLLTLEQLKDSTSVDLKSYLDATVALRARMPSVLTPGPDIVSGADGGLGKTEAGRIRLLAPARDGSGPRVLATYDGTSAVEVDEDRLNTWARASLIRLAPWAAFGLIEGLKGDRQAVIVSSAQAPRLDAAYPRPLRPDPKLPARQRQGLAAGVAAAPSSRFAKGYRPVAVLPQVVSSDRYDDMQTSADPRLVSAALSIASRLEDGAAAMLAAQPEQRFWLSDQQTVAFRPHAGFNKDGPLSFALPSGYSAPLPSALVPVPETGAPQKPDEDAALLVRQSFAPALIVQSVIAGRPGAMAISRAGLEANTQDSRALGSEAPVHARLPRLPVLGRHDRPRASAFEAVPVFVSSSPTALLHGPGTIPEGGRALPGLDRGPDALHALRLELEDPTDGVLRPGWTGRIRIRVAAVFRADPTSTDNITWTIDLARLVLPGGDIVTAAKVEHPLSAAVQEGDTPASVTLDFSAGRALLAQLPAAASVRLDVRLSQGSGQDGSLRRQVVFELLTAQSQSVSTHLERPVFLRFEDPEYSDQLSSAVFDPSIASPYAPTAEQEFLILAAEATRVRPDRVLAMAVALRGKGGTQATYGFPANNPPRVRLERRRVGAAQATRMKLRNPEGSGLRFDEATQHHVLDLIQGSPFDCPLMLDCGDLLAVDGDDGLVPTDSLRIVVQVESSAGIQEVKLELNIVAAPDLPENGSAFSVLAADMSAPPSVRAVLYATAPPATLIELVDTADLVAGSVRRRASYQWRAFLAREGEASSFLTVQKIGETGASWLPVDLNENGWARFR